jgi:D-3-phosphoglycerate dehydrogenase
MKFRVLIPEPVAKEGHDYLLERGYEIKNGRGIDKQKLIEDAQDCDAILVRVAPIDQEVFLRCPSLKVVGKHGVGYDNIDLDSAKKHGVRVTYTPNANAGSVAELAFALILNCAKKIPFFTKAYQNADYTSLRGIVYQELAGRTLGLAGLGRIGQKVARYALAFDMKVLAYDPYVSDSAKIPGIEMVQREELFRRSDFVSLHMPVTKNTEKSVGRAEFDMMKITAFLINTSRGALVDEAALIKALQNKEIAGAGLDVTDPEPAAADNPMFGMENVILTPHIGGSGEGALVRMAIGAAAGIDEVLTGKPVSWPVV